jgi:hypothetical protein
MASERRPKLRVWLAGLVAAVGCVAGEIPRAAADESYAQRVARIAGMTPEEKEELRKKKERFDALSPAEQQRIRELHAAIAADPDSRELMQTMTRYHRWLATLDPTDRYKLLDIKDPQERVARIKELLQQQEERRFRQYFANLPEEDRKAIYQWIGEFVATHAEQIRSRLPEGIARRLEHFPDDEARRRELFLAWQRWRREFDLPSPGPDDYAALLKRFSSATQKQIEAAAQATAASESSTSRDPQPSKQRLQELQLRRVEELVRTALYSRFFPQVSQQELLKFYQAMKPDDPRRKLLEGKEGEELHRELQRMYNWERSGWSRGGPPDGPGPRGFRGGPPPDGRGFRGRDGSPPGPPPGPPPDGGRPPGPPPGGGAVDKRGNGLGDRPSPPPPAPPLPAERTPASGDRPAAK